MKISQIYGLKMTLNFTDKGITAQPKQDLQAQGSLALILLVVMSNRKKSVKIGP